MYSNGNQIEINRVIQMLGDQIKQLTISLALVAVQRDQLQEILARQEATKKQEVDDHTDNV